MNGHPLLEARAVSVRFGGLTAVDAVSGTASSFITHGVVEIAKTSALAISVGDVLYWDAGNSVVNKTTSSQRAVGIAVAAAANPSATVKMRIGVHSLAGT